MQRVLFAIPPPLITDHLVQAQMVACMLHGIQATTLFR